MINNIEYRRSLHTKNKAHAKKLYEQWVFQYQVNKINGTNEIPLIHIPKQERINKVSTIQITEISLERSFNEHIRVNQADFVSEDSIYIKKRLLKLLEDSHIILDHTLPEKLLKFQEKLRSDFAISTVDKYITFLKTFLKWCVKKGYLESSIRDRIDFLKRKKSKKVEEVFTDDELERMWFYCIQNGKLDFMNYMITLFLTGARPNEILKMTKDDIDFEDNTIKVWMNKTQYEKTTPINPKYLRELEQLANLSKLDNGCIFEGSLLHKEHYAREFKKMREDLNLNPKYVRYTFRHTAGDRAYDMTQDIYLVADFLGHQDIRTTQGYISSKPQRKKVITDGLIKSVGRY
ncbi:MAG: tyrosine-type recombinase/integrase [Brevinema sp.]